ncbi:hypothetical protein ACLB2K_009748 [Fragaria x ananassa]
MPTKQWLLLDRFLRKKKRSRRLRGPNRLLAPIGCSKTQTKERFKKSEYSNVGSSLSYGDLVDKKVLNVGEELWREILPLRMGSRLYRLEGIKPSTWYEVKISYPASIPASFSIQLKRGDLELPLNGNRRLLNTEKLIFKSENDDQNDQGGMYVLVTVEPEGVVAIPNVQEREHIIFNIVCDELLLGIPHQACAVTAATAHPPEKTKPHAARKRTIPTGTRIGLNSTTTGEVKISTITVPVKVNPDKTKKVAPTAPVVKTLAVLVWSREANGSLGFWEEANGMVLIVAAATEKYEGVVESEQVLFIGEERWVVMFCGSSGGGGVA